MKKLFTFLLLIVFSMSGYAQSTLYGDVNGDLEVNIADVNAVIEVILSDVNNPSADVNGDGEINITDINVLIDIILNGGIDSHLLEVCELVAEIDQVITSYYEQCGSIDELKEYTNEIEAVDGVEYVFYDNTTMFVKIEDFGTIFYSYYPNDKIRYTTIRDKSTHKQSLPRAESPFIQKHKIHNINEASVLIVNQQSKDESRSLYVPIYEELKDIFLQDGFVNTKIENSPSVEFFRNELFDNDYVFLITHGLYEFDEFENYLHPGQYQGTHWLMTSVEVPRVSVAFGLTTKVDKKKLAELINGYDTKDVTFNTVTEKRNGKDTRISYLTVSEHFINSSEKQFKHPGEAVLFNTACQSMKGPHPNKIDSIDYSLARVFQNKGVGAYLGYDETNTIGKCGGTAFFERLLSGMTIKDAFDDLQTEFRHEYMTEDGSRYWADLVMLSTPEFKQTSIFHPMITYNDLSDNNRIIIDLHSSAVLAYCSLKENSEGTLFSNLLDENDFRTLPFYYGFELSESESFSNVVSLNEMRIGDEGCHYYQDDFLCVFSQSLSYCAGQTDAKIMPNTTYWARAYVYDGYGYNYSEPITFTTGSISEDTQNHEWVDLGLPSGTLWATCNVGASAPEEYGDYFAWGETAPKEVYNWETYKWCNGSSKTLTKYCTNSDYGYNGFVDNKTELEPVDDAAYVNWGSSWRMPTLGQQQELVDKCTWTWMTQNGVNGLLVTGPNGNTMFLPAAGSRVYDSFGNAGSWGYYLSRTLYSSNPSSAYYMYFNSDLWSAWSHCGRIFGLSVRAVYVSQEPKEFKLSETEVNLEVGESKTIFIFNGNGSYSVESGGSGELTVEFDGEQLILTGVEAGNVDVIVTDHVTNASATLAVTVTKPHEYVDLGLPSGTIWATCNVGASAPEEYGDYFAWGETEPKDYYNTSTYKWCNGSYNTLTKYCTDSYYGYNGFVDNKTELDPEDDAAYVNWGLSWRMPSSEQLEELCEQCTWTRTTQNGVNGRLVTGPNGNTMFLPAAGYRWGSSLTYAGTWGRYWSRTLYSSSPGYAYNLDCESGGWYSCYRCYRDDGFTVRAVRVSQN